jgi:hypothetical protein
MFVVIEDRLGGGSWGEEYISQKGMTVKTE